MDCIEAEDDEDDSAHDQGCGGDLIHLNMLANRRQSIPHRLNQFGNCRWSRRMNGPDAVTLNIDVGMSGFPSGVHPIDGAF